MIKRPLSAGKALAIPLALCAALGLASCASLSPVPREKDVLRLVDLINAGKVTSVEGLSQTPFALDTETLYLESDVETLWNNLAGASFAMNDARFAGREKVASDSWKTFADSYDMKNFFEKYTGKDTYLVTVETAEGRYYLLLERKIKGYPRVRGLKGPVK